MSEERCDVCKFCKEDVDPETATTANGTKVKLLRCQRYPPIPVWSGNKLVNRFPRVFPASVCGEFKSAVVLDDDAREILRELMDG